MLAHYLNWYLEILHRLGGNTTVVFRLRGQIHAQIRQNVNLLMQIFGTSIVIDFAHSIARVIFSAYFLAESSDRQLSNGRGQGSDIGTVFCYCYLIFMICKKGSQLRNLSKHVTENFEDDTKSDFVLGRDAKSENPKLKQIVLETDYLKVDLRLIAPVKINTYIVCQTLLKIMLPV